MAMEIKPLFSLAWNGLLDLIYPPKCLVCGVPLSENTLCESCLQAIQTVTPPFCWQCGAPTVLAQPLCLLCQKGFEPPWDWSHTLGWYTGSLRTAIHRLKYAERTALAAPLAKLLAASFSAEKIPEKATQAGPFAFDIVVPVPLHPKRVRERGYNQAERIAYHLAKQQGWGLETRGIRRVRATRSQTALGASARRENVAGAFEVTHPNRFKGLSVLVIDDVLTTGATLGEVALQIRSCGARRVWVMALARD